MSWLHSPSFKAVRALLEMGPLSPDRFARRVTAPVVFLCGKAQSPARDRLRQYIEHSRPGVRLFYADHVWRSLQGLSQPNPTMNALEMEDQLGRLSDAVIVVVESAGTLAEIGAFALSPELRRKLIPILDAPYRNDESFVRTGPLTWISKDSVFGGEIWVPLERVLECTPELDARLNQLHPRRVPRNYQLIDHPKALLFLACDLVRVYGPVSGHELCELLQAYCPVDLERTRLMLALSEAIGLVRSASDDTLAPPVFSAVLDKANGATTWQSGFRRDLRNQIAEARLAVQSVRLRQQGRRA